MASPSSRRSGDAAHGPDLGVPTAADGDAGGDPEPPLGETLRRARKMLGMTLRAVEAATNNSVTNGYLSQIENGSVAQPSPNVLYHLSQVYDLDYGDLLVRAGHRLPSSHADQADQASQELRAIEGLPVRALSELTPTERRELADYIEFLRYRRSSGGGGGQPPRGTS